MKRALLTVLLFISTVTTADVGPGTSPQESPSLNHSSQEPVRPGLTPAQRKVLRQQGLEANMTQAEKAAQAGARTPKGKAAAARVAAETAEAERAAAERAAADAIAAKAAALKAAADMATAERLAEERTRAIIVYIIGGFGVASLLGFLMYIGMRTSDVEKRLGLSASPAATTSSHQAPKAPALHLGASRRKPDVVVVDLETTGLSTEDGDRVVEIGLVRLGDDLRAKQEYTTLINPERDVGATRIHGIRDADVQDAPTFVDIAGDVGEFLEGAVLVAHYAPFDMRFLRAEFDGVGLMERIPSDVSLTVIDTVELARIYLPELRNHKLPTVCAACGIPEWDHHGALDDAKATAMLLARLAERSGGELQREVFKESLLLPPGWTGLAPLGRTHPRKTLASMATATQTTAVPTSKPPPLDGEIAVFTGGLGIAKSEAMSAAEMLGCKVRTTVSGKTTIVVVGDPDGGRWSGAGSGITDKHRQALARVKAGQRVRILTESDFMVLAGIVSDGVITEDEWVGVRELVYGSVDPALAAQRSAPASSRGAPRGGIDPKEQQAMRRRFSVRNVGGRWEVRDEQLDKWRGYYSTRGDAYEARRELWAKFGRA